jgi:hypothetical protein
MREVDKNTITAQQVQAFLSGWLGSRHQHDDGGGAADDDHQQHPGQVNRSEAWSPC